MTSDTQVTKRTVQKGGEYLLFASVNMYYARVTMEDCGRRPLATHLQSKLYYYFFSYGNFFFTNVDSWKFTVYDRKRPFALKKSFLIFLYISKKFY